MLAKKVHEAIVSQFLGLQRRVTKVGEEDHSNCRLDIRAPRRVSGNLTKERVDGSVTHLDDVVGNQTMGLSVHRFQRLSVRPLGETEHGPFVIVEPVGDVTNLVLVLNSQVEFVRGGDVGSSRTGRLVSIEEQGHARKANSGAIPCEGVDEPFT